MTSTHGTFHILSSHWHLQRLQLAGPLQWAGPRHPYLRRRHSWVRRCRARARRHVAGRRRFLRLRRGDGAQLRRRREEGLQLGGWRHVGHLSMLEKIGIWELVKSPGWEIYVNMIEYVDKLWIYIYTHIFYMYIEVQAIDNQQIDGRSCWYNGQPNRDLCQYRFMVIYTGYIQV